MPKGSILVIDDEAEIREGLELLLTSEGYTGLPRRNGRIRARAPRAGAL